MQTISDFEAQKLSGGGLGPIMISPTINVTTGLTGILQLNNGANVATSLGGSATAILGQSDLATVIS